MNHETHSRLETVVPLLLAGFAGALYAGTLGHGFSFDDVPLIERNPLLRSLGTLPELLASDYRAPESESGLYRPVVMLSYAVNYAVGGLDPRGYHAVNVALHALVSVLVWRLARRVLRDGLAAALAGFLFAALAVHTEAVANVVGRAELLATTLFLTSLSCHAAGRDPTARRPGGWLAASLCAYALAMACKESAAALLGVVVLYDIALVVGGPEGRVVWRQQVPQVLAQQVRVYLAYGAVLLLYLVVRAWALDTFLPEPLYGVDNPIAEIGQPWALVSALYVALLYVGLALFPVHLAYDYSFDQIPVIDSLADPRFWAVGLAVIGVLVAAWRLRASRQFVFLCGFYVVTFSTVSNVVVIIGTILGERLLYLPSVAFCLGLVVAVRAAAVRWFLPEPRGRFVWAAVLVVVIGFNAARTVTRSAVWASDETLFLHDVNVVPRSTKALYNAGTVLQDLGRHEEALVMFERSAAILPVDPKRAVNAAWSLEALGRRDEAIAMLEAREREGQREPELLNALGYLLVERGLNFARATALLEEALALAPDDPDILDSLGWSFYRQGRFDRALQLLRRSLALDDTGPSASTRRAHLQAVEGALGLEER
ncbi:DUF1736 domain-containing protein [Myxococcota bacterium]|nr:DUF1736 domain-containing protein [Myxococcota bacterium]